MKKQIHRLIIILFIFLYVIGNCYSQVSTDLMKYWYYRDRLKYFVVPGNKIGESQIICTRNHINASNDPSNAYPYPSKNVDYGQHGKYNGLYIGVLATEYYLLNENGQTEDAAKTLDELNEALDAVIVYWDEQAETYWGESASYNGFFIRGNVPCDFLDETNLS